MIHDNLCKKLYDMLLRNHLKHKKHLTGTQIAVEFPEFRCCRKLTGVFRKNNIGLDVIEIRQFP